MTTSYRKKLIEVALPLVAINAESAREKSIRHGHPSTLHLWWARRPLAACRAVLFASLVNDPDDDPMYGIDEEVAGNERAKLFNLIEELVKWENSNNPNVINRARAEIARSIAANNVADGQWKNDEVVVQVQGNPATAHDFKHKLARAEQVNAFLAEHAPPVLDPFAGGGSIPLEAQRLGLRAYASDLNPVAVLINKALIEIPPKFAGRPPVNLESSANGSVANGKATKKQQKLVEKEWRGAEGLAEDVRYYGQWMRDEAEKRIGHLYPKVKVTAVMAEGRPDLQPYVGQELTVIAWLWARTIQCPNPACRARAPLVRSFRLSGKKGKECFAKPVLDYESKQVQFEIATKGEPPTHTTDRTGARCLFCDTFVKKQQLRDISMAHGIAEIPLAIVADSSGGRVYLNGTALPPPIALKPTVPFLEQPITNDRRWFSPPLYGMPNFADMFTARQLATLTTLSDLVVEAHTKIRSDAIQSEWRKNDVPLFEGGTGNTAYADAVATYLGLGVDKITDYNCTLVTWIMQRDQAGHAMTKQALPMVWDFTEVNPLIGAAGDLTISLRGIARVTEDAPCCAPAIAQQLDATAAIPDVPRALVSTDPPYYDNIGYADLSDFFYIWLRRSLSSIFPSLFSTVLTPKATELIASPYRHDGSKDRAQTFFEEGFARVFGRLQEIQHEDFPLTVYYAFKQSESDDNIQVDDDAFDAHPAIASTGWETMLTGLVRSGFCITGTWPMRTERGARSIGIGTNALASSIILVCRPRPNDASLTTRKQLITALSQELPEALRNLQRGNIAPVDLAQAAIGPGMAVFTRYAMVLESDGSPMTVRTALGLINQALDEVLAEQEGEFDGDTRWALAWFEQFGLDEGPFGDAELLSKAKNTAINGLVEAGVVLARAGKVRLVRRDELNGEWDPTTDRRLTVWEITQHLIRTLDKQGESGAATLMHKLGGVAETARDLAYRLYNLCERKKWAEEALAYNGLVIAWPELSKLALAQRNRPAERQQELL
ncbi:MAG TPA: DUF1156 domain-containing protein [Pirellulales bacterium]|nr:DUF1156 domain-containing protein [Pirellulales bacterium]